MFSAKNETVTHPRIYIVIIYIHIVYRYIYIYTYLKHDQTIWMGFRTNLQLGALSFGCQKHGGIKHNDIVDDIMGHLTTLAGLARHTNIRGIYVCMYIYIVGI